MANKHTYEVAMLQLGSGPTQVGGLQSLNVNPSYGLVVPSTPDGGYGVEDMDFFGLQLSCGCTFTDVTKLITLLVNNASGAQSLKYLYTESGSAPRTYLTHTLAYALIHAFTFNIATGSDAVAGITAELRASTATDAATLIAAMAAATPAQTPVQIAASGFAYTYPTRLIRPNNFDFLKHGGTAPGDTLSPLHVESFSLSGSAELLKAPPSDSEVGYTAVDLGPWNALDVSVTFRDNTVASSRKIAADLITEGQGVLTLDMASKNSDVLNAYTLTLKGVRFHSFTENGGPPHTTYTVNGKAYWYSHGAVADKQYNWVAGGDVEAIMALTAA